MSVQSGIVMTSAGGDTPTHHDGPGAQRVRLDPITVEGVTEQQTVDRIMAGLSQPKGGWVITANLDHYYRAIRNKEYRELLGHADLVVADGMPLVWAARLKGTPLPERVAGSNLIDSMCAAAASAGRSVFLIGGSAGTAEVAGRVLQERHKGLDVAGTYFPPFGFETDEVESNRIREVLLQSKPDIVFVALGSPKQERLIRELRELLPNTWWMGVGISFSFLAGEVRRAPSWMQRLGAEWIHRLIQEPRRLARRYLLEGIPCALGLLWRSWRSRSAA